MRLLSTSADTEASLTDGISVLKTSSHRVGAGMTGRRGGSVLLNCSQLGGKKKNKNKKSSLFRCSLINSERMERRIRSNLLDTISTESEIMLTWQNEYYCFYPIILLNISNIQLDLNSLGSNLCLMPNSIVNPLLNSSVTGETVR